MRSATRSSCVDTGKIFSIVGGILKVAAEYFAEHGDLSRELLLVLGTVFSDEIVGAALELVDDSAVAELSSDSSKGRSLFQVRGPSGTFYTLIPACNRCPCEAWMAGVWNASSSSKSGFVTCKHVLAAALAKAFDEAAGKSSAKDDANGVKRPIVLNKRTLTDDQMLQIILDMD